MRSALAALVLLAACGGGRGGDGDDDGAAPCQDAACADVDAAANECATRIGDRTQPIELVPMRVTGDMILDLADNDAVALFAPPQGGEVMLIGARARNVDGCATTVSATLRDPSTGVAVASETRPIPLVQRADGWGYPREPLFFSVANVVPCPMAALPRDVYGQVWQVDVRIDDGTRSAVATRQVVPTCAINGVEGEVCRCLCDADYMPGVSCGGPGGGG